jgi:CO dehydrogenase maturation factor
MKIVVAGKGGAGKTTVSGTVARALARSGRRVIALDADLNPMLGIALGLGVDRTEALAGVRQALQDGEHEHEPTAEGMVDSFGADAPDGVRVVIASRMDRPDAGCACCGVSADKLLRELEGGDRTVLGDLEAGIGVLTRMDGGSIDMVLVVTNPTAKSIEVARRALQTPVARGGRVVIVANRVRGEADVEAIRAALGGEHEVVRIPEDPVITRADVEGVAPLDLDASAPGVRALMALGDRIAAAA